MTIFLMVQKCSSKIEKVMIEDLEIIQGYTEKLWAFLPIPICDINGSCIIINAGQKFFELFGYAKEEIIGENIRRIFESEEEYIEFKKELESKKTIKQKDIVALSKQKEVIPVSLFARAREEGNVVVSYFVAFIDLREIMEKEAELNAKVEELERFQQLATGRELKMSELKKEIEKLTEELNKLKAPPPS